ncbi:hypothetical protein F6R98_10545 [Candidatus Methylospira mobilis]|uniref:Phage tail protein n=1 Tax=Candidatus Methylospira mobilis TaxID=1808979 RepID=A0A5Q0BGR6_9GAMM|nr:hypothetical protein [Candidatus Methylospira mobilis]QFY43000.1 hypothetical protein F6R98_10545 [Candidatus Methylospira mobilis]
MTGVAFTRQLGSESGVQLNPLRDESELPTLDNADQTFAVAMRATRGRIDKPFAVNSGNIGKKLGSGESIRLSALNEAWVQVWEAVNRGAYNAIVQRLITNAAVIKWAVVTLPDSAPDAPAFSVSAIDPAPPYLLAIKHLECHNDGIKLAFHADESRSGGVLTENSKITLRIFDSADILLYEFRGSLDPAARDDFGNSAFLPDVVSGITDAVEIEVGATTAIAITSNAYGYDAAGKEKWVKSDLLMCFDEGGKAYSTQDYHNARDKLQRTQLGYAYIASGGTQSIGLIAALAQLSFDTNKQFRLDIPGNLTVEEAITFKEQLNLEAVETAHLIHVYWAPLKSDDPTGVNGKGYIGTSALNIALSCLRNAQANSKGFASKNYPIAGREWPVQRTGLVQVVTPGDQELSALAKARINPVIFETYTGGGRYVFRDSLTCAPVENVLKKLISVVEMSTSIDDAVTRYAKDVLQLPMDVCIKRMTDFLQNLFEGAQGAKWITPSSDPAMGGSAFRFTVQPNAARPYDTMDYAYWLHYDGTNRQSYVTQTLSR